VGLGSCGRCCRTGVRTNVNLHDQEPPALAGGVGESACGLRRSFRSRGLGSWVLGLAPELPLRCENKRSFSPPASRRLQSAEEPKSPLRQRGEHTARPKQPHAHACGSPFCSTNKINGSCDAQKNGSPERRSRGFSSGLVALPVYTWKEEPQPQVRTALGLLKVKPRRSSPS